MKLAVLSRAPHCYSTRRLVYAAEERGHSVRVLNTLRFAIDLTSNAPDLQYRGRPLPDYDAVLPRIGASITYFGTAVVRQFEQMDVFTPNTSNGILNSRDKLRALQVLSRHDLSIPPSTFVRDRQDAPAAIRRVGGAPVIIKLLEGTQGVGVILAPDAKLAEAIIQTLQTTGTNVLLQRFIAESCGRDIRALDVGDRVVAAMRRIAQPGEFRSNVHRGGSTEAVSISPEFERAAVRAAQIMGLRVAGVDMLEATEGPLILEVNSSPGLEGIEKATGLDVAGAIIDHIDNQVAFPELDVQPTTHRQHGGTASRNYSSERTASTSARPSSKHISETATSPFCRCTGMRRPRRTSLPSRVLQGNDRLLCFGNLEAMRALIPTRRRRRPRIKDLPEAPLQLHPESRDQPPREPARYPSGSPT